jgi:hypothetical protein
MNKKYQKYIEYIVKDIELPYLKYLDQYGLKQDEVVMVLSKVYNESVTIKGKSVYDQYGNEIYYETSNGSWYKREYDSNGNQIYYEDIRGYWYKREYDANGNKIYSETSNGYIVDNR